MASLLELQTIASNKGNLTIFEKIFPVQIQFVGYFYGENFLSLNKCFTQGWSAFFCVKGNCNFVVYNSGKEVIYKIEKPHLCFLSDPEDKYTIESISSDAIIILVSTVEHHLLL